MKSKIIPIVIFFACFALGFGVVSIISIVINSEKDNVVAQDFQNNDEISDKHESAREGGRDTVVIKPTPEKVSSVTEKQEDKAPQPKEEVAKKKDTTPNKTAIIAELNRIIKSRGSNYPRGITLVISGNGSKEQASSFSMVYQYLKTKIWLSATVVDVDLDPTTGKVSTIYIRVVRNTNADDNSEDEE